MNTQSPGPLAEWIDRNASYRSETRTLRSPGYSLIRVDQPPGQYDRHAGDEFTLQLVTAGSGKASIRHGTQHGVSVIKPGRMVISPTEVDLSYRTEVDHTFIVLGIQIGCEDVVEALDGRLDFGALHDHPWCDPAISQLLLRMWDRVETAAAPDALFTDGARLLILSKLAGTPVQRSMAFGGLAPWQERRATEALGGLLAEDLSLATLAKEVGLSPFHFSRAFKQSLGSPPHRYRTRLRLEKACELLETTNAPVTEIALSVGYDSSQALARIFARDLGVTPTQWRRERRK